MSNRFVSQQLPIPSMQMGQLEPTLGKVDPSVQDMQIGLMGSVSNGPASHQHFILNTQEGLVDPLSSNPALQRVSISSTQMVDIETKSNSLGPVETMLNNAAYQHLSAPSKRKAPLEHLYNNSAAQQLSTPNKRLAQTEHRPWLQQVSGPIKRSVQMQSTPTTPTTPGSQHLPTPNKKVVSGKSGSQRSSVPKNQTAALQPSPKAQTESFESVRSKMRESLAAALELVSEQKDKSSSPGKNSQSDTTSASGLRRGNSQPAESVFGATDALELVSEKPKVMPLSHEDWSAHKNNNGKSESEIQTMKAGGKETKSSYVFSGQDVSFSDEFFVKDELLQGNGLSWVLDSDMEVAEKREIHTAEEQNLENDELGRDKKEEAYLTPQILAFKIEEELFKLFGGVNKKYKEKGRSLLFNLKDRNNPELSERVLSGEITPERLCSMTAEELASKELSQWRMAKAEELAQMVVLPDADVDIRRLVRKTHKGEFQVEVEENDTIPMEVSVEPSSPTLTELKTKEMEAPNLSKPDGANDEVDSSVGKSNIEDQDTACTLTISSNEGNDLMQGLMVDDVLKDADFLPPIVSLDEFMESLDSEPPFEILPVDAGKMSPISDKDDPEIGSESKLSELTSKDVDITKSEPKKGDDAVEQSNEDDAGVKYGDGHADMKPSGGQTDGRLNDGQAVVKPSDSHMDESSKASHAEVKSSESYSHLKLSDSHAKSEIVPPAVVSKPDRVWEGVLQLNTSVMPSVIGVFKSGEKTSANEWLSSLEIKGRVRLDAFEKFLQELPLSRSRAVMVMHFSVKEGSLESEHASIQEVADSYVVDERVGFAEPANGVELYFCPPHKRTREMLSKILSSEHFEALNNIDNGLIGVIQQNFAQNPSRESSGTVPFQPLSQTPSRPVDQMRELIHKYGQPKTGVPSGNWQDNNNRGFGVAMQPWNDDDDDIPEWQPQAPQHQQQQLAQGFHQPTLRPHLVNQQQQQQALPLGSNPQQSMMSLQSLQPQMNATQGTWWVPPVQGNGQQPNNIGCQPNVVGQFYGAHGRGVGQQGLSWRPNAPKSRGF
ncbi:phd finger protein 3 [Quercus suber]|uniref:Phd finger protein 3 n=1 Tax=Quercus suber TaxID=58331 RepID=A0AAW0IUJ0_QUESU